MERDDAILFFNQLSEHWDVMHANKQQLISNMLGRMNVQPNLAILDIGCGTGIITLQLLNLCPRKITAVDISPCMIAKAQCKSNDARITYLCNDFLDTSLTEFDLAILYNTYPHFKDKEALAQRVYSSLSDRGRLIIAHDHGKQHVNHQHSGAAEKVSCPLESADVEATKFLKHFTLQRLVDNEDAYLIELVKRMAN